jgi:flagellar motor switch protein FliN/FliY
MTTEKNSAATPPAASAPPARAASADPLAGVEVELSVELGRHTLTLDQALTLGEQSIFELDKMVGEPVEVTLNGKPFARGEVVTVADHFGVRITELLPGA